MHGLAALLWFLSATARGATIVCDGVLGNSGESGETVVRFSSKGARGMGVVFDRFGSLWDRAGRGALNRYAPDGRMLAQYRIPASEGRRDKIALAGDTVVLLVGDRLYALGISSPPGSEANALDVRAEHMSFGSLSGRQAGAGGRVACVDREKRLFLIDPATGVCADVTTLELPRVDAVEMDEAGAIYVQEGRRMHKLVDGRFVTEGWPKGVPGERAQLIPARHDGFWFGHSWHGTIKRFDAELQPAPGVVQGGASGSFIGHLAQNSELTNGRGMALLSRPSATEGTEITELRAAGDDRERQSSVSSVNSVARLYAVSGIGCVMHLLEWRPGERRMEIVRRIGALPRVPGIGLDRQGRVFCINGSWNWDDAPDTPQRLGTTGDCCGQVVMLDNDSVVCPGIQYGNQPRVLHGALDAEVKVSGHKKVEFARGVREKGAAAAVYRRGGKLVLLLVPREGAGGRGNEIEIDGSGRFRANGGQVALRTASPLTRWTTLAMRGADTLLAAGDGHVIEMARDGSGWRETDRWRSWQGDAPGRADSTFGGEIHITADDGRLWVADTERARVICLDLESNRLVAAFGTTDRAGTGLDGLSEPRAVAARGNRAVVHDSGNQRLLKLSLE